MTQGTFSVNLWSSLLNLTLKCGTLGLWRQEQGCHGWHECLLHHDRANLFCSSLAKSKQTWLCPENSNSKPNNNKKTKLLWRKYWQNSYMKPEHANICLSSKFSSHSASSLGIPFKLPAAMGKCCPGKILQKFHYIKDQSGWAGFCFRVVAFPHSKVCWQCIPCLHFCCCC